MKPNYQDNLITTYHGDARNMAELTNESVQCVVTSPPYWGLRKYAGEQELVWGGDTACPHEWQLEDINQELRTGQGLAKFSEQHYRGGEHKAGEVDRIVSARGFCRLCGAWHGAYGLEPTPELYVEHTLVFLREIRRVLRRDGVVFWNVGDSYFGGGNNKGGHPLDGTKQGTNKGASNLQDISDIRGAHPVIKPKDLCLIPFRVAIAAQEDGWWVRSVIIWSKPNSMPESVADRPTESHEYILMLTKSKRYYWDPEAVREPYTEPLNRWGGPTLKADTSKAAAYKDMQRIGNSSALRPGRPIRPIESGRNIRSVWDFPTRPYPGAHFAVFPEKLPELCIKAATPEAGSCPECGAPWVRIIEKGLTAHDGDTQSQYPEGTTANRLALLRQAARKRGAEYVNEIRTLGWEPSCSCHATPPPPEPSIVLDPFMGSGTTLWVAKKLGRRAVGYDLSSEYCQLALERNRQMAFSF